ncbi:hypothetical protein DEO72_LG2g3366 [Vigna unguiculata]|uniref:Uncharacterized protein n=1 Tax=Vigna unguiculata TaxID=3917 RepID=A0A4D6L3K6_VIGUN|nr:hypothetical protein DEO72_LG2g3366 [Vigna unguiculata]
MKEVKAAEKQSTSSLPFDESVGGKMNVDFIFFSDGRVTKFLHMLMVDILLVIGERDFEVEGSNQTLARRRHVFRNCPRATSRGSTPLRWPSTRIMWRGGHRASDPQS